MVVKHKNQGLFYTILFIIFYILSFIFFYRHGLTIKQSVGYLFVAIIAFFIHKYKYLKDSNYVLRIIGIDKSSNRDARFDYLRVLAVLLVILTHTLQIAVSKGIFSGYLCEKVYICIYILALSCNTIYIMISGALLLKWKEESLAVFYLKRLPKIIFPMLIYYYFFLWQNNVLHEYSFLEVITRLFTGTMTETPHFWLLLVIISLYVLFPFLRYLIKAIPYKMLTSMVIVGLLFMIFTTLLPQPVYYSIFMADWVGVAIIGYWLSLEETKKYFGFIEALGLLSAIVICILILNYENYLPLVTNCSPIMTLFSMMIFAFVYHIDLFKNNNLIIGIISKLSFSLILVHWWVVNWLSFTYIKINPDIICAVPQIVLSELFTLLVSVLVAFCIDNYIVVVVTTLWDAIIKRIVIKNH